MHIQVFMSIKVTIQLIIYQFFEQPGYNWKNGDESVV